MENTAQENISTFFKAPSVDGDVMMWTLQNQSTAGALREPEFYLDALFVEVPVMEPDIDIPFSARFMLDAEPRID